MKAFQSYLKTRKLHKIERELAPASGGTVHDLLIHHQSTRHALEDLLDLVEADPDVRQVMAAHGATKETLRQVYVKLVTGGAGNWVEGHWVAASTLASGHTLAFVLENTREADDHRLRIVSQRLGEYFAIGDTGPVK